MSSGAQALPVHARAGHGNYELGGSSAACACVACASRPVLGSSAPGHMWCEQGSRDATIKVYRSGYYLLWSLCKSCALVPVQVLRTGPCASLAYRQDITCTVSCAPGAGHAIAHDSRIRHHSCSGDRGEAPSIVGTHPGRLSFCWVPLTVIQPTTLLTVQVCFLYSCLLLIALCLLCSFSACVVGPWLRVVRVGSTWLKTSSLLT